MRLPSLLALLPLALGISVSTAPADPMTDRGWELLAIDGEVVKVPATLRIGADGSLTGKAPCNSWGASNRATLPALEVGGIRATRRACPDLDAEQRFFEALAAMTEVRMDGPRNLILTGPEGRSMEFVTEVMNSLTVCKTCPPKD